MIFRGYLFGILYGLVCLVLAFVLYKLGLAKKYTRKVVHILVGFEWVILYHFLGAGIHFLAVCIFFTLLLIVAHKGKLMPMISSEGENSPGTVYYGVAMTGVATVGMFLPEIMLPFGIGIMCTSIGDGLAGVVGQLIANHNPKVYREKTLFGSIANLLASFASALVLSALYGMGLNVWECLAIATLSLGLELVVGHGLDNIAITWGVTAFAYLLMYHSTVLGYAVPILATPFVIAFVLEKRALTGWGTVGAVLMDIIVSIAFGNFGFIILASFFFGSVIVDKIKNRAKNRGRNDISAKGDHRDLVQVIANGLVPTVAACAFILSDGNPVFAVAYVAALAEALADTVASGLGVFSNGTFDVFRWRKCEKGISGGMSVVGTVSALVASALVPALAVALTSSAFGFTYFWVAAVSAFLGTLVDSLLGSLIQVKYRCPVCSALTERTEHCETKTERASGLSFVDNDVVNVIGGFASAILAIIILSLI